ncbi:hypothetical protein [Citrobacter amalonaticus]|nr:hypothetical protein [Citrobacter amalonaticus]
MNHASALIPSGWWISPGGEKTPESKIVAGVDRNPFGTLISFSA